MAPRLVIISSLDILSQAFTEGKRGNDLASL